MALTLALACGKTVDTNSDDKQNAGDDQNQKPGGDSGGGANGDPIVDAGGSSPTPLEATELTPCRDLGGGAVHVTAAANADWFLITNPLGASLISTEDFHVERTFTEHFDNTLASVLSSDASWGATIGDDAVIRFWDAESGRTYAEQELEGVPRALVLPAASGATQVTALDELGRVTSFDGRTGDLLWAVELPEESFSALHASAREDVLWATTRTSALVLSSIDGSISSSIPLPPHLLSAVSHDGARLATAALGGEITLFDAEDGTLTGQFDVGSSIEGIDFDRNGNLMVGYSHSASLYNIATTEVVREFVGVGLGEFSFAQDGMFASSGGIRLAIHNLETGARHAPAGHTGVVRDLHALSGDRVVFSGVEGPTQFWNAATGAPLGSVPHLDVNQGWLQVSELGISMTTNERIEFFDLDDFKLARSTALEASEGDPRYGVNVVHPDSGTLIVGGTSNSPGHVRLFDALSGVLLDTFEAHDADLDELLLSPDGTILATAGTDTPGRDETTVKLWSFPEGVLLHTLEEHEEEILALSFSPDGKRLVTGGADDKVFIWSTEDGSLVRQLHTSRQNVDSRPTLSFGAQVAFSGDGSLVASKGTDWSITTGHTGVIEVFDAETGNSKYQLLSLAEANLGQIAWSSSGDYFFAGAPSGVRVWCLDELAPH